MIIPKSILSKESGKICCFCLLFKLRFYSNIVLSPRPYKKKNIEFLQKYFSSFINKLNYIH